MLNEILEYKESNKFLFNMNCHIYQTINKTVVSAVGLSILCFDEKNFNQNYFTPHLVTGDPEPRYVSWAMDFFNVKREIYDFLFSKRNCLVDNSLENQIQRIELYLNKGIECVNTVFEKKDSSFIDVIFEVTNISGPRKHNSDIEINSTYIGEASKDFMRVFYKDKANDDWLFYIDNQCKKATCKVIQIIN